MNKSILLAGILLVIIQEIGLSQTWITGVVKDINTHEPLIGVNIFSSLSGEHLAQTSANGHYRLNTSLINDSCVFRYLGYTDITISIQELIANEGNIFMKEGMDLETIVVVGKSNRRLSQNNLSLERINSIPTIGAKPDILKAFQTLPSVSGANEGSSLLLVRGGNPGENLYLLDDTPLIYVNHLGGFFSVFNPDMIASAKIYKGGFPANYAGKLSSVVDITQREGNKREWEGSMSIGITDVSFSLEGPFIKEKMSILVTGRKTLTDPLMRLMFYLAGEDFSFAYGFHDINTKLTYSINPKNTLTFNLYQGDDYFTVKSDFSSGGASTESKNQNIWGNWLAAVGLRSIVNDRTSLYHNLSFNRYRVSNSALIHRESEDDEFRLESNYVSSLQNFRYKGGVKRILSDRWLMDAGVEVVSNFFVPNRINNEGRAEQINSNDFGLFAENQIELTEKLNFNLGLRFQGYFIKDYSRAFVEPRLEANYSLNNSGNLYLGYHRQTQTAHLLFNSGQVGNSEIWVPSTAAQPVSSSLQYSGGYRRELKEHNISFEVSAYYRTLNNLTQYREGFTTIQGDPNWREKLVSGVTGNAYGVELMVEKHTPKMDAFLSYAYGRSFRQSEELNAGQKFAFDFDRPHTLSLSNSYKLGKRLKLGFLWTLQSGLPFTPVVGRQFSFDTYFVNEPEDLEFFEAWIFGPRNSDRMRFNHRLDVSLTYKKKTKRKRDAEWTLSVYNVYNRQNPYFHFYNSPNALNNSPVFFDYGNRPFGLYQVSFLPIIPSISYRVIFDKNYEKRQRKSFKEWMHF